MTAATLNGNGTERHAAAAAWRAAAAAGEELTGAELGERFGFSARWGRQVIADAREVEVAASRRAAAPTAQRHGWLDTSATLVVGLVAAAASFAHMRHVALLAGESDLVSWGWPLTVDGLAIVALRRGHAGRRWLWLALGVSVAANVLSQYPETVERVAPGIAAWPPLALLGCHQLLHRREAS